MNPVELKYFEYNDINEYLILIGKHILIYSSRFVNYRQYPFYKNGNNCVFRLNEDTTMILAE